MGTDLLQIGRSGLMVSKKSLETTGHNISNANVEGYSRKRVQQQANPPVGDGNLVMGTGVKVKNIQRFSDDYVEKTVSKSTSQHMFFNERANLLSQVEEIFNEVNSDGLNKVLGKLFNSFRELSNQPENEVVRSVVRENARIVVRDFHRISDHIKDTVGSMDRRLEQMTLDINSLLNQIGELNSQITELENGHGDAGDIRDQRDLAVKQLSEYFQVNTYMDERNNYIVSAEGVGTLVVGRNVQEITVGNAAKLTEESAHYGSKEVYFKSRPHSALSNYFQKGKLAALIETRNSELKDLQDQIDQVAYEISNTINAIHRRGFSNRPIPIDESGNPRSIANEEKFSGIDFFRPADKVFNAASSMDLSTDIKSDLRNIATALEPNSPGDNRVALAISKLQHEKLFLEGTTTIEEYYLKSIGNVGLATAKSKVDEEQAKGILAQHQAIRERISGVSIDEETSNMIKFQQAYDAAARVIRTSDEMFKSVLEMWRP